jgi:isopenicillin N synthase-like dioxygenase
MPTRSVPVIDIETLRHSDTLAELDAACRNWGFFQVTNHGIADSVLADLRAAMRGFFALPAAAKQGILRSRENPWGYYDKELTKNVQDWKEVYDFGPADGAKIQPQWPAGLPGFESAVRRYSAANETLAFRLMDALASNLGADPAALRAGFEPAHSSFLRLNHYPPCPAPATPSGLNKADAGHLGINFHTDAGALTLLLQDDQPGLEVYRDGHWYLVEPISDALVINIGDIVQVWSNDTYRAALHRVVLSAEKSRYSAPYFFNPAYSSDYAPLPSMTDDAHPPHYRAINWGEFRTLRADGDYADYGEEVQISHYAL